MPVSSRRCGMITRREAERLCKSFLGDNTPPRLPDDFAFNVQHKCAWGCRGSFLPSRYNSSRAKYVQPDAANFNSWRRHMSLSGNDYDEKIIHAWEDVKAMFNGGTRKRLVGSSNNPRSPGSPTQSTAVSSGVGSSLCGSPTNFERDAKEVHGKSGSSLPQRSQIDSQYNYGTVAAAAAVVGVTAVAAATELCSGLHVAAEGPTLSAALRKKNP
ncbi:GD24365 [Drosophila simulans]|uniref:GD24365 n=1 Tax=Drosophila simulans TaxID=7240 RepID=B4R2H7_DROSI|nr:GD24365 [Drosophila simulans]